MGTVNAPALASALIPLERDILPVFRGLENGQLLTGTVGRSTPEGYIINFRGNHVLVRTSASLESGQQVQAELVDHNGRLHLRLVQADVAGTTAAARAERSPDQQIMVLLEQLGMEATAENAAAARMLMLGGLPPSHELIESLVLMLSGNVPFDAQLVQLTETLRAVLARVRNFDLSDQITEIIAVLENAIGTPAESDLAEKLRLFLANSGVFAEAKMKMLLKSGATAAQAREAIAGDLKFALLRLSSLLRERAREFQQRCGTVAFRELQTQVAQALKILRGQQVQNLAQAELSQLLLHVPFLTQWGLQNVRIRILYDRTAPERERSRPMAVVIALNTSNMGRLRAVLQFNREKVFCHFTAERESVAELIRLESGTLKERLETLRFSVGGITCGVGSCEDSPLSQTSWSAPFERAVDVKV